MRILGVDPGTQLLGVGIIETSSNPTENSYITSGCVRLTEQSMAHKLLRIHRELHLLIDQFSPSVLAIEKAFFAVNAQSALLLSQVRGIVLLVAAERNLSIFEYSPRTIKASVCSSGKATKEQIGFIIQQALKLPKLVQTDAADALATALCHAYRSKLS